MQNPVGTHQQIHLPGLDLAEGVLLLIFGAEAAHVRIGFVNGTHTISTALFSAVKPGDTLMCVTGLAYDTMRSVIGIAGDEYGSLKFYGVGYDQVDLTPDGEPDYEGIAAAVAAVLGEGADLKVERTAANVFTISVNGVVYDTYVMSGVTEEHKVTDIIMGHYGNKGEQVALPFAIAEAVEVAGPIFRVTQGNWDLSDQNNGKITIVNKKADGSSVITHASDYKEVSVTVKDYTPSKNADGSLKQGDFSMQISFIFDNGKQYQVRLHNTDADGNYKLQNMGGTNHSITGWKWLADLTAEHKAKLLDGNGVKFTVKLVGANAELYVDGTKLATVALGAEYDGKLAQIQLCMNGNKNGQNIEIPFELK